MTMQKQADYRAGFDAGARVASQAANVEIERLRAALTKIAFITGGIDTPSTSNAAHYEAVNALAHGQSVEPEVK